MHFYETPLVRQLECLLTLATRDAVGCRERVPAMWVRALVSRVVVHPLAYRSRLHVALVYVSLTSATPIWVVPSTSNTGMSA